MKRRRTAPVRPSRHGLLVAAIYLLAALIVALTLATWEPPVVKVMHLHHIVFPETPAAAQEEAPKPNRFRL